MANITVDIGYGFYESDALPFANQRCVNLYPNIPQAPALKNSSLFGVQGIYEIAVVSRQANQRSRGGWVFEGVPYSVNGNSLYAIERTVSFDGSETFNPVKVGEINGNGMCSFADNGQQLMIIDDLGNGYIYQPTASPQFQPITDGGFTANGTPKNVSYMASYFIVITDSKKTIVSAVNDGLSWNSLDVVESFGDPDGNVASFVLNEQLFVLGTQSCESYGLVATSGTPIRKQVGFLLEYGCAAPFTVKKVGNRVFWIGNGENELPVIYEFNGSSITKISTTAIDNKLHSLRPEELASMFSWSYGLRGNSFVAFSSSKFTFVYDTITQRWHERESTVLDSLGNYNQKPCRIKTVLNAYNKLIVTDNEDGRFGVLDANLDREYDYDLISYFTSSPLYNLGNSFSLPSIELLCERGVGNSDVPDPKVRLEISRDGVTFENPRTRQLGAEGNRSIRPIWNKNGRVSQLCIFKVTVSDSVKRRIFGLDIKYKTGVR